MKSIGALGISMLLLTGCAGGTAAPVVICPHLADPPPAAIDALEAAGRADPSSAAWVIALADHLDKLEACR